VLGSFIRQYELDVNLGFIRVADRNFLEGFLKQFPAAHRHGWFWLCHGVSFPGWRDRHNGASMAGKAQPLRARGHRASQGPKTQQN
jgi:hypothetical protein